MTIQEIVVLLMFGAFVFFLVMGCRANKAYHKMINSKAYTEYPISDYLHNALRYLGEYNFYSAYEEICYAITYAGGELNSREIQIFEACKKTTDPKISYEIRKTTLG